jgi:hypothetical protein
VAVSALSQSEAVNLVGNVNLPAISMAEGNPRLVKPKNLKDLKNFVPRLDKPTLLPSPGTSGQSGVGASLVGVYAGNTVVAKIEDGVVLRADTLQVTADNEVLEVNVGASGGSSKSFGLNGTAGANVVHSTTLAQIENGAVIDVGSGEILDPAKTDPADNGSVFVTARDSTWLFNVLGGVAVSEGVGVGASAGFNILVRDTRAVLGDIAPDASSGSRGSFTSGGNVRVSAENGGVSAALVVSGAVAKDAGDKDKADDAAGSGSGATQGSAGSNQADKDYADWRGKMANVLKEAKAQGKFSVNSDIAGAADATSDTAGQTSQNKTGVGVAASVAVNWADDDVRAYVLNTGPISLGASTLTVEALNGSGSISLAGGAALVLQTKSDPGGGFGGAFGLNVLYGATEAFMDGTAGLALGGLALNADRRGWTVSLAAGFAATSVKGTKGVSLAGSVGVNVTAFTTEAALRDVTGLADVSGDVILDADDTTVVVAVGGSVGFGGKAGFGAAMGVNVLANTTRSEIDGLTNFRHGGDLAVQARSTGIVVSATGSAGIAAGKEAGYGGAGTASVNVVANTIEANVLNVTETAPSSGDYVLRAGDFTGIFSFAGAIGAGKTFGGGVSIAVNSLANTVRSRTEKSTLKTSGSFTSEAEEGAVVVGVNAAGAGAEKFALAGSAALNLFINTVESSIVNSIVSAGGAVNIEAMDSEVCVAISGGVAISTSQAAIGAAIGLNLAFNAVSALVDGSEIISGSTVGMISTARAVLVGVTLGGAGGEKFALGGSFSGAIIADKVTARVAGGSTVSAAGDISLGASDATVVVMVAGGFAGSAKGAVGAALSTVYAGSTMLANIDGSGVTSTGGTFSLAAGITPPATTDPSRLPLGVSGFDMPAATSSNIVSATVGGAGSAKFAGGIGISVNIVHNDLGANITGGSTVNARDGVILSAVDASAIDALAFGGAGAGEWAGGGAVSANVIANVLTTSITDSTVSAGLSADGATVTGAGAAVTVAATSSSIIRSLGLGVSGGGRGAVSVAALGNAVANTVTATIDNSDVRASGDVIVAARDIAPLVLPSWMLPSEQASAVDHALEGSPIALDANILAVNVSVAGSGQTAVGVALMGNVVANTVKASIVDGSTVLAGINPVNGGVLDSASDVIVAGVSDAGIIAFSVGVGASGNTSVQASGFGNVITNRTSALIDDSTVTSGGFMSLDASDQSQIRSLSLSVAASGSVAVGVLVGANVIVNDVSAVISGSTVTSRGALNVAAENDSDILAFTGGVAAAGSTAVMVSRSGDVVTNRTTAAIRESSTVIANGDITLEAGDVSIIDALAFGVTGSGSVAVGVAAAANVIANDITAAVNDSRVTGHAGLNLDARSSAGVHALAIGVAGSGTVAVQVTALGNAVSNRTRASISRSMVTARDNIVLAARDEDPGLVPDWLVPAEKLNDFNRAIAGTPIDLTANIIALNVSVAGSGVVAVNAVLTGNTVANSVTAEISDSTVTSTAGDITLDTDMSSGIVSVSVGVAGSGTVSVDASGFGNVIASTAEALISEGSAVTAEGEVRLDAETSSLIRAAAVSVAGSGVVSVGVLIGANVVTSTTVSDIVSSTVNAGSLVQEAHNTADIMGLTCGVAGSGAAAVVVSLSANVITNTTRASIRGTEAKRSRIESAGDISLDACDSSEINTLAIGVSGTGGGAVGVGIAAAVIANSTVTEVSDTTLITGTTLAMDALSSSVIRSLGIGVSGSGLFAVQISAMGNVVDTTTRSEILRSEVDAGAVRLHAGGIAPVGVVPFTSVVDDTVKDRNVHGELTEALDGSPVDLSANILALNVSVAGSGAVAVAGALTGNLVTSATWTRISDSTVTASGDVLLESRNDSGIASLTAGVAGSGAVAVNATGFGNVIDTSVAALIENESTVTASTISLSAEDSADIVAAGIGVAGSGSGAVNLLAAVNVITDTVKADINHSAVKAASALSQTASADAGILAFAGGVAGDAYAAGNATLAANVITNQVEALIGDRSSVQSGGAITQSAVNSAAIDSLSFGLSGSGGAALGAALAANVIDNATVSGVFDSTVTDAAAFSASSRSEAIIRTLNLGVSKSGGLSLQFTVLGNWISSSVKADIVGSTVTARGGISLSAADEAPSIIPDCFLSSGNRARLDAALVDSPLNAFAEANILALNVSLADSTSVAVNAAYMGNVVNNTVQAAVIDSVVTSTVGSFTATALSNSAVISLTAGAGSGGDVALNATQFGNFIRNTVDASVRGASSTGATVQAEAGVWLSATDSSTIRSIGLGLALSKAALAATIGYNSVKNTITAEIENARVSSNGTASLVADSTSTITSFVGGAAGGLGAAQLSLTTNKIENTIRAAVVGTDGSGSYSVKSQSLYLSATDASTIDSMAFGLSGGALAAGGMAESVNRVSNSVNAIISGYTVAATGMVHVAALSEDIIRSYAIGVAGAGLGSLNASKTVNDVGNTVAARIEGASVTSDYGTITVSASEKAPAVVPDFNSATAAPAALVVALTSALEGEKVNAHANIVSFAGSVAIGGVAALGMAKADNEIHGTITAEIVDSMATAKAGDVRVLASSDTAIACLAAGFGAATGAGSVGGVAVNASTVESTMASAIKAGITGTSTVSAAGNVTVEATDTAAIDALAFSLAGGYAALGGARVVSTVDNATKAHVSGTDAAHRAVVGKAGVVSVIAKSEYDISGRSLGATLGGVSAGCSVVRGNVGGSTAALIGDFVDIGAARVDDVVISASSDAAAASTAWGLSGGVLGAGGLNSSWSTVAPAVSAAIGSDSVVTATDSVALTASATPGSTADTWGLAVGLGLGAGLSLAEAESSPDVIASVGQRSRVATGTLDIEARQILPTGGVSASASATGSSGGLLLGANATWSSARGDGSVFACVWENSVLDISGNANILADLDSVQRSTANGKAFGALALGGNTAHAASDHDIQAWLADGVSASASVLSISADGVSDNLAQAVSGAGGAISSPASEASTASTNRTRASIGAKGAGSGVNVDELVIDARHKAVFNAAADSSSGGVIDAPGATVENTVETDVEAALGKDAAITARQFDLRADTTCSRTGSPIGTLSPPPAG